MAQAHTIDNYFLSHGSSHENFVNWTTLANVNKWNKIHVIGVIIIILHVQTTNSDKLK